MVNFTCNHCGESLQKPRVEKHYQSTACRRNGISVSCMDCFKDFKLEEYVAHIKCITEEERYSAKGSVHAVKKGEVKQSTWVATVNSIIEEQINAKPGVKNLLEMISKHDNIPRKQTKFANFVSSMSGGRVNKKDITEVWSLLEAQKNAAKEAKNLEAAKTEQNKDKAKKRKSDDQTSEDATEDSFSKKKKYKSDEATVANGVDKSKKKDKNKEVDENSKKKHESDDAVAENGVDKSKKKRKNKEVDDHSIKKCENDEATAENGVNKSKKKRKNKKVDEHSIKKCESDEVAAENGVDKSKKKRKNKEVDENSIEKSENDEAATENGVKKSKKIRKNPEEKEDSNVFCWKDAILEVVNKKEKLLTANQLKKEVFEKYEAAKGNIGIETKVAKTYNKKLKKLVNIKIENDLVSLI